MARNRNRVGVVAIVICGGTLVPVPLEDIDTVANGNGGDEAIFIDDFVPTQQIGGVGLIPNKAIALAVFCAAGRGVEKDQAGGGFSYGNASDGRRQADDFPALGADDDGARSI